MIQGATIGRAPMLGSAAISLMPVNIFNLQNESVFYLLLPR